MGFSFFKRLLRGRKDLSGHLEDVIGYKFSDEDLLRQALSHRSNVDDGPSNERLEFLGDAVLDLVVSEYLFGEFPDFDEGALTKTKASLVNETVLSKVAGSLKLGQFVFLSKEEERSGGREKSSIISDAAEALIGAIYLDGGLKAAKEVIIRLILSDLDELINDKAIYNYKGDLLELMQGNGRGMPKYEIVDEQGPDHIKIFEVAVSIDGIGYGTGKGTTKKEAEQKAAKMALSNLKKEKKQQSSVD
jgi:ribonuclease-3